MSLIHEFEIRVLLMGNVSAGKTTVLNALFRDMYGEVSMKRTTAAANVFRLSFSSSQSPSPVATASASPNDWTTISKSNQGTSKETTTLEQIKTINASLRQQTLGQVEEMIFDVELEEPLCDMHKDTRLIIVDSPGINEAGTESKYQDYIEQKWDTFDCAIIVMDGSHGVNTEEQVHLLKCVKQNLDKKKGIPLFVLANKIDDPDDEEKAELVTEARREVEKIFGVSDRVAALQKLLAKSGSKNDGTASSTSYNPYLDDPDLFPVFIPISALNAFIFRCAARMTVDQFHAFDERLIAKVGRERIGRDRWPDLSQEEKVELTYTIITDPKRYQKAINDSNFDSFTAAFANAIGGSDIQRQLVNKQIQVALSHVSYKEGVLVDALRSVYTKSKALARYTGHVPNNHSDASLQKTFWTALETMTDDGYWKFEGGIDVRWMAKVMDQLTKYHSLSVDAGWIQEETQVVIMMKRVVRRLIGFVIGRWNERWVECTEPWKPDFAIHKKTGFLLWNDEKISWNDNHKRWFKEPLSWNLLTPLDWLQIFHCLTMISSKHFFENFGAEKMVLETLKLRTLTHIPVEVEFYPKDSCIACMKTLDSGHRCSNCRFFFQESCPNCGSKVSLGERCSNYNCTYIRKDQTNPFAWSEFAELKYEEEQLVPVDIEKYKALYRLDIPKDVSDPKHFGHAIWKFSTFMEGLESMNP